MGIFDSITKSGKRHKFVGTTIPDYFELEHIDFGEDFRSPNMSVSVNATTQVDKDGYGSMCALAGKTDLGYWYEVELTYNWILVGTRGQSIETYFTRGFSFQLQLWDPAGNTYTIEEAHLLGEKRANIKRGDAVDLNMRIKDDKVIMAIQAQRRERYEYSFPAYGSRYFEGTGILQNEKGVFLDDERGYFTGAALEFYHTTLQWGAKHSIPVTFTLREPSTIDKVIASGFQRKGDDKIIFQKWIYGIVTDPSFSLDIGGTEFRGTPRQFTIQKK